MASSTVNPFPLATEAGATDNSAGSVNAGGQVDNAAGASGGSFSGAQISPTAIIAIIVVVSVVAVLGIAMAVLFYLTKKKEWKLREKMRRSARKVVTALTPRRSEFPKSVKEGSGKASRGRMRLDDVPPTPRLRPEDIEKGLAVDIRRSPDGRSKKSTAKKWPGRR
ncbi:uncharacterized protein B0I36DRAFT_344513 [Microdochium trichocladiopsis]|uniref:Uncharacterized protein n=1 Tax=Microdochium trichocladiopsis TaxID=1682393 RepID=A0A9P8YIX6_9PEZI|nr:uncharacterized protein B0I36DRAFT_344513 [Microdochium trichocladiopsis]KAH7040837.1 hypothetical protein B0I36DRAFT_344513 [Microdochium trichocladiopsis]